MRESRLRSSRARKFVPRTTDSKHLFPIAQNVLERDFKAQAPNRKWVCDITYVATDEGWLYVTAVLDLFSRKVVGWSMAEHMRVDLVSDALAMALARRKPAAGLLHHSDLAADPTAAYWRRNNSWAFADQGINSQSRQIQSVDNSFQSFAASRLSRTIFSSCASSFGSSKNRLPVRV